MALVHIPFLLHEKQRLVFKDTHRYRVTVNGRRWGKTALGTWELIIAALSYKGYVDPQFPLTCLGILPTANQARVLVWRPLVNILSQPAFGALVKDINKTSMTIELVNKVLIKVVGANDNSGDRLRGLKLLHAWFDETQDIRATAFWQAVLPAMLDTPGSRALFTGTPKGKHNFLYDLAQLHLTDTDWAFFNYPTWTNPIIDKAEIEKRRLSLPPRLFNQEYQADFVDFPGKIYSELGVSNKHYGELPRFDLTVMGVDFGDLHPSLNVLGRSENKWYYLEGYSPNADSKHAEPIPDVLLHNHIRRLVKKWSVRSTYCDPSRPSSILSIRGLGDEPGYRNAVAGYNPIWEGIGQVHSLITQNDLLFTEGHNDNIPDSLDGHEAYVLHESYHRLQDKNEAFTDQVADGFFSHTCDGTRYALAMKRGG
jgi:hypothetical protein